MTQAFACNYNIKILVQLNMPSSQNLCTENIDASELLLNTLYEVQNINVSPQHSNMRKCLNVPIQRSVLKCWKFIQRGNMQHSLNDIPEQTQDDVEKLLRHPLQATQHSNVLAFDGLLCAVTHACNANDDTQSIHVGTSDVQIKNTTFKTHLQTLRIKHKHDNLHFTLTAIMVPVSNEVNVCAQHFVQLNREMPVCANEVLKIYGKCFKADAIRLNALSSHKINRDTLRNNHVLLCKELGLTTTPKITNCINNVLYHTFVTTTNQDSLNSTFEISCVSIYT